MNIEYRMTNIECRMSNIEQTDEGRATRDERRETKCRGFTLVETVVASAILCGAVLVVGAISTRAVSGTRLNRQYEMAALVADRQLRLIDYVGIDNFIESGQMEGVFGQFEPGYHWKVATEYQDIDSLYLVTITVSWVEQNHSYSITVDTMLDGASVYATATESTASTTSSGSTGTE